MAAYLPYYREEKMYTRIIYILLLAGTLFSGCRDAEKGEYVELSPPGMVAVTPIPVPAGQLSMAKQPGIIETGMTEPREVVDFARTMIGTPYLYASTDPANGFDCSGFITYVFNRFDIKVPRSSVDFTNEGKEVDESEARPGDLILFTGTDSTLRVVGHMGIVISNTEKGIEFIHSSSGKARGVVITPLERYYRGRFMKVIRVFPDAFFA
jgi:cell wall-associated NlpC family hydrolase